MNTQVEIVKRDTIPPVPVSSNGAPLDMPGELRDFSWNDRLREFMPAADRFSVSWLRLSPGEIMESPLQQAHSLMVVYAGGGEMFGDVRRKVAKDDVVVLPAGCKHGFIGGPSGLNAVTIALGEGLKALFRTGTDVATSPHTFAGLIAYNDQRLRQFQERPIFRALNDGSLDDAAQRNAYLLGLRAWHDATRGLFLMRQATCVAPSFHASFREDSQRYDWEPNREVARRKGTRRHDPVVEAIADWFVHQMVVLDNIEKAALGELVIKPASISFQREAVSVLGEDLVEYGLDTRIGFDPPPLRHGMLRGESPRTYQRLEEIVCEAWDMLGAMTDRIVELARVQGEAPE